MVPPQMSAISASRSKVTCQAPSCLLPDALLTVMAYVAPEFHWLRIAAVAVRPPDAADGDDEAEADDFFPLPAPVPEEAFDEPEDVPDAAWSAKSASLRLVLLWASRVIHALALSWSIPPLPEASQSPNSLTKTGVPALSAV